MLGEEACSTDGSVPGFDAPTGQRWAIPTELDHDNTAKEATKLSRFNVFMYAGSDKFSHRTAWVGAGDGVLFYDASGDGTISEKREDIFPERDPAATSDLKVLRTVVHSNGNGKFSKMKLDGFKTFVANVGDSARTTANTMLFWKNAAT